MTALQYLPAAEQGWLVMAGKAQVLFLDRSVANGRRDSLWALLNSGGSSQDVLDELTTGGISKTPAFGLLAISGVWADSTARVSAIVRGSVNVTVSSESGEVEVSGEGTTTWAERTVEACSAFVITTGTGRDSFADLSDLLPLMEGVVLASRVSGGALVVKTVANANANESETHTAEPVASTMAPPAVPPIEAPAITVPPTIAEIPQATVAPQITIQPPLPIIADTVAEATLAELPAEPEMISAPVVAPAGDEPESGGGYDYLFGETIMRTVEEAAVREVEEPETSADSAGIGDHDGKTSIGLGRAARHAARQARAAAAKPSSAETRALSIELSTGSTELLDQPIVIGRAPSVTQVSGASLPRLVTIAGPDQDISRNHVHVVVEGGTVVVTDLHSRNGTMIVLPGRPPQQLRAGEPTSVIPGTSVDLGGGVSFMVREG